MAAPKTIFTYPLNGTTRQFPVSFDYLSRTFVQVTVLGPGIAQQLVYLTDFRFTTPTQIETTVAWGAPYTTIEVRRVTSVTERLVNFNDASILHAADLNTAELQVMHIAEEARDAVSDGLGTDNNGNLDARGRRIINLANAIDSADAVPYGQYITDSAGAHQAKVLAEAARDTAIAQAGNASASASAAASSASSAATSASNAAGSNSSALAAKVAAEAARDTAVSSASAASASASSAATSASNAAGSNSSALAAANLAHDWAEKLSGPVTGSEYSAHYWANQAWTAAGSVMNPLPRDGSLPMTGELKAPAGARLQGNMVFEGTGTATLYWNNSSSDMRYVTSNGNEIYQGAAATSYNKPIVNTSTAAAGVFRVSSSLHYGSIQDWAMGTVSSALQVEHSAPGAGYAVNGIRWTSTGVGAVAAIWAIKGSTSLADHVGVSLQGNATALRVYANRTEVGSAQYWDNGNIYHPNWTRGASTDLKQYIDKVIPNSAHLGTVGTINAVGGTTSLSTSIKDKWFYIQSSGGTNQWVGPIFGVVNVNLVSLIPAASGNAVGRLVINSTGLIVTSSDVGLQGAQIVIITSSAV